jgi:ubiquinone/menaquinone biosynthesis C-methylase UbiE
MTLNQPATGRPADGFDVSVFNAFEAAGWNRQASTYDSFIGHITSRLADPLLDAAGVEAGSRVLDLATGPGYVAARAAERGASVVGVDVAPAMVQLAREMHPGLDFREADGEALPFEDGSFDAVVSNFVVPHLGRHERVVSELVRVLKPGGRLSLTTWDNPDRMRLLGVLLDAFAEAGAAPPDDLPVGPPFFHYADDEQFAALLRTGGLTDVFVETVRFDHPVASADELWDGMHTGTVRTSAMILAQPENVRRHARAALDRLMREYQHGDRFELPVAAKVGHGRKESTTS